MKADVFSFFGVGPDDPRWSDWTWQYRNRITDAATLSRIIPLKDGEIADISRCLETFRMAITPYYASLMDRDDHMCPIRAQSIPSFQETVALPWDMKDPLNEESDSPVKNIVHRYPDRVLFLVTRKCAMYCRHCTRRRLAGEEDYVISASEFADAVSYIERNEQIHDVLISGGDPLTLSDRALENIVSTLRRIDHVETIRIGTRIPVTMPMRITPELLAMLKKYQPIWINTHFNHPDELTGESLRACAAIVDAGIPLGNQTVLLKNINDNVETMKRLLLGLVRARIRPYYLYQCDLSEGLGHFRTRVETGVEIIKSLTGTISGYALPKFVIDAPEGGGKVPVNPDYMVSMDAERVVMRNYKGEIYTYHQP